MAINLISSDTALKAWKAKTPRLSDGGGLYLIGSGTLGIYWWRFDYTYEQKRKTISLGTYPNTGLSLARENAVKAREDVAAGVNPSGKRKTDKLVILALHEKKLREESGILELDSFEGVARRWFKNKVDGWSSGYSEKVIARLENDIFPYIGRKLVDEISPPEILSALRRMEDRGVIETAHRALESCSCIFRFAIAEGFLKTDPARDLKDALKTPVSKNFQRSLILSALVI